MGEAPALEPTGTELVAILRGPHFRHNMGALFHNLLPQIAKMARAFLALATLLSLSACVTSKSPLLGPESRVLPFPSGTTFAVYERDTEQKPWTRQRDVTLVADQQLEVRKKTKSIRKTPLRFTAKVNGATWFKEILEPIMLTAC